MLGKTKASVCYVFIISAKAIFLYIVLQSQDLVHIAAKHFDGVYNISNAPSAVLLGAETIQTNLHEI